jgi:hypothetical protein
MRGGRETDALRLFLKFALSPVLSFIEPVGCYLLNDDAGYVSQEPGCHDQIGC